MSNATEEEPQASEQKAVSRLLMDSEQESSFKHTLSAAKRERFTRMSRAISRDPRLKIVMRDFNAKVGRKTTSDAKFLGAFGLGTRKSRGQMLAYFLCREKM
ncbi:hypothetical protein JTB14_001879 [Gonioctena quinquepunctata]|nr:hypothetical protein JTB14_001879 [Gonioctena quinquepunctata]